MKEKRLITLDSLKKSTYFIIYDDFIIDKKNAYPKLSIEAKILYFKMRNRYQASLIKNWIDENNVPYIYFSLEEIMEFMRCAKEKAFKLKKTLVDAQLIKERQIGQGNPNMIYLFEYDD